MRNYSQESPNWGDGGSWLVSSDIVAREWKKRWSAAMRVSIRLSIHPNVVDRPEIWPWNAWSSCKLPKFKQREDLDVFWFRGPMGKSAHTCDSFGLDA